LATPAQDEQIGWGFAQGYQDFGGRVGTTPDRDLHRYLTTGFRCSQPGRAVSAGGHGQEGDSTVVGGGQTTAEGEKRSKLVLSPDSDDDMETDWALVVRHSSTPGSAERRSVMEMPVGCC